MSKATPCSIKHLDAESRKDLNDVAQAIIKTGASYDDAMVEAANDTIAELEANKQKIIDEVIAKFEEQNKPKEKKEEVVETPVVTESEKNTSKNLEAVGRKLIGKKDKANKVNTELTSDDIKNKSINEIFPKSIIDNTDDHDTAAFMYAVRDSIPKKPTSSWKINTWVSKVENALSIIKDMQAQDISRTDFLAEIKRKIPDFANKVDLLSGLERKDWSRIGAIKLGVAIFYDDGIAQPKSDFVSVEIDKRQVYIRDKKTIAEALPDIKERLGVGPVKAEMKFTVRGSISSGYNINKTGDPEYRSLTPSRFETSKAAFDYIKNNREDLIKAWDDVKERDNIKDTDTRNSTNRERSAKDWRKGRDISSREFEQSFGLDGTDFGNYVKQGKNQSERQWMINGAYDALMDLADLLEIPPKAIGLNNTLGIQFGANGSGNANAHYDPNQIAINLTKGRGAGSLAHEWFHAMDNYFHKLRKYGHGYITDHPTHTEQGVRSELEEKFKSLVNTLNSSPMAKRMPALDKGKKAYWATTIEIAARSFEGYVLAKLEDAGYHNDYLVNVKKFEGFKNKERYPYHTKEELVPVSKAFSDLFNEMQVKEEDGKTVLYSKSESPESFARKAITMMVSEHPEMMQVPIIDKSVKDLSEIIAGIDKGYEVDGITDMPDNTGINPVKQWNIKLPEKEGRADKYATISQLKNGNVYIDVSMLDSGEGGNVLYAVAGNFARNTGVKFIGDPRDLSKMAMVRRTENMLSLAAKFGTTDFIEPHKFQEIEWIEGDDQGNFERLIAKSQENIIYGNDAAYFNGVPDLQLIDYNFETNQLEWSDGQRISPEELKSIVGRANDRIESVFDQKYPKADRAEGEGAPKVGGATITRAAIIQSLVRAEGEGRSGILGSIVRESGKRLTDAKDAFYSGNTSNVTGSTVEDITALLPKRVKALLDAGKLIIVQSVKDLPEHLQDAGNFLAHTVWHGSPHDHNKFDSSKIGTGEGAQAFGYGLYFTDRKDIAEWYRKGLSSRDFINLAKDSYDESFSPEDAENELLNNPDLSQAQKELITALKNDDWLGFDYPHQAISAAIKSPYSYDLSEETKTALAKQGKLYEVELVPELDEYLDWDKPLSEQSEKVRDIISKNILNLSIDVIGKHNNEDVYKITLPNGDSATLQKGLKSWLLDMPNGSNPSFVSYDSAIDYLSKVESGEGLYRTLKNKQGSDAAASDYLHSLGIRGIKYAAERGKSDATNYVVFSDEDVSISAKYSMLDGVEALYDNGKNADGTRRDAVYLVADMLNKDNINPVLSHEVFHRAKAQDPKVKAALERFEQDFQDSFNRAARGIGSKIEREAYARVIAAKTKKSARLEEYMAYQITAYQRNPESLPTRLVKAIKDFIGAIRAALVRSGLDFGYVKSLTPADLAELAGYGAKVGKESAPASDAAMADIRYSKNTTTVETKTIKDDYKYIADKARTKINDVLTTNKSFNWWHKTVGTQFHKSFVDDDFKKVFDKSMQYEQDTAKFSNEAADLAPDLLPKLEGLKDALGEVFNGFKRTKDSDKVSQAIFQTTIDDKRMADEELVKAGYSQTQRDMYHQFFASVNKSLDDLAKSEMYRAAMSLKIPAADPNLNLKDTAKFYADNTDDSTQAKEFLEKAEKITELKNQGYAPLMRFGKYTVDVIGKNPDGTEKREFFGMFESETEANEMRRIMEGEYPDTVIKQGIMSQSDWQMFKGLTPETMTAFAKIMNVEQGDAFQSYLKMAINNRSAMKRLIHRKKMPGFASDPQRVLASFITSNAKAASKNMHLGEMVDAITNIPKDKGDVKDEAVDLYNYVQNPSEAGSQLRGALFTWYLGGSIASAAVNLTQTFTTTLPYLHQFGKTGQVASLMADAMKLAAGNTKAIGGELGKALKRAEEEGVTAPHELHMLYGESMRTGLMNSKTLRPLMKAWSSFFSLAEGYNRRVAFIAAYNLAVENREANPFEFASKAVDVTQFVYSKSSRPNWARSTVGSTVFTFKTFMINYLEFLSRLPRQEQLIALGVLIVFSGLGGLPGSDDADDIVDTLGQTLGYNTNAKAWKEKALSNWIGKEATGYVLHGMSQGLPFDVSQRLSAGNIIPGSALFKRSETDKTRDVLEFVGPAGSLAQRVGDAVDAAQSRDGIGIKAATIGKTMLPKAFQDAIQGIDMLQTGQYRDTKGRKVTDASLGDVVAKMIGFQPTSVAEPRRAERYLAQDVGFLKTVKGDINELWAQGIYEKNPDKIKEAKAILSDWNKKNPDTPIKIKLQSILKRAKQMKMTSGQRLMKSTPKEIKGYANDMLAN